MPGRIFCYHFIHIQAYTYASIIRASHCDAGHNPVCTPTVGNMVSSKPKILFLCTGNSARSQKGSFEALSAGIEPKVLNPLRRSHAGDRD